MDHLIYTAMGGADRMLQEQQVRANNIANAGTTGFRADIEVGSSKAVPGAGYDSRHMTTRQPSGIDTRAGTMVETGRDLDVAIQGEGFLVVATDQGEGYTRAGNLTIGVDGALTVNGHSVLGEDGPIVLPPFVKVAIAADGMISVQGPGDSIEDGLQPFVRLKLVKPLPQELSKNSDGLLLSQLGGEQPVESSVRVLGGHLEHSNVSAVEQMIATMRLNRGFEMQMKMFNAASDMVEAGNRLMRG